jgi:hypothetical protein
MAKRKPNLDHRTLKSRSLDSHSLGNLSDDELLDTRICDLPLSIRDTPLEARIGQLNEELAARGLDFKPHCWLSEEWFSPDGVPGIAIPFYLAHPRLIRLERKQLLEVEGGTKAGTRLTPPIACEADPVIAAYSEDGPQLTQPTINRFRQVVTTCCIWRCGMLRRIHLRILRKHLPSG